MGRDRPRTLPGSNAEKGLDKDLDVDVAFSNKEEEIALASTSPVEVVPIRLCSSALEDASQASSGPE